MKSPGAWLTQAHTIHRVVQIDARQIVQLTFLFGVVFSLLLAIPFVIYHQAESGNDLNLRQAEQERVIRLAAEAIHQEMDAVLSDLRYLSQHNEIKAYLEDNNRDNRLDLAKEYLVLLKQKRLYDQIRFIGLGGMEEVRVDFANGKPQIVADQALQDKHDRYYFQETQWLSPGQIYVSPFDLNVEQGAIEQPIKPVIRFAVPVADTQGLVRGMVVLNYLGQRLRGKLSLLAGQAGNIWLLNPEGYWLLGSTPEEEWGFMFPERSQRHLARLYPPLWQQVKTEKSGISQSRESLIRFERIYPLAGDSTPPGAADFARPVVTDPYFWTVAVVLSQAAMQAANTAPLQKLWTIYGTLVLFAIGVAGALAFTISRSKSLARVLEKVIDNLPVLIAYVDAEQRYRFNNMAYEALFGLSPKQLYGKTMRELFGEVAYQELRPHVEQALAGKRVTFERRQAYASAGLRDVVVSYIPDTSPQGEVRGFYVMVNDVSLVKESERREQQRMLELAHVSRLASMGEMATEMAHEINQPLAAIAMYSAACLRTLEGAGAGTQMRNWLEAINTQAKRAGEIVRRLRRFVKKGEPQYGPVDLNQVASEVAALLGHEAKSQNVEVILELAEGLPLVQGELVLIEQVVFNLARNAMDAVLLQPGERRITLRTSFDAQQVYVEIRDTGFGVDPALGERIFDSFVTNKQEGLGMGLTISRSIIDAHAGTLRYVINPEGGTTFMFSLARETAR